jgi:putative FmdB family regulatory protein
MPTYEYACQACGHAWEATQRMSDDPLRDCPSCGKPKAKRQISAGTGFILKGGGWYSDLYGSPKKKSDGASPGAGSDGSEGAGKGAEKAPAEKTEKPAADKPKAASKD